MTTGERFRRGEDEPLKRPPGAERVTRCRSRLWAQLAARVLAPPASPWEAPVWVAQDDGRGSTERGLAPPMRGSVTLSWAPGG